MGAGVGGFWNSLISKKISPLFSFFNMYAYSLKIIHCSLKCNQARYPDLKGVRLACKRP